MRPLPTLGLFLAAITSAAVAAPKPQALPRVLGGSELRLLIRGAVIGEAQFAHDWMNEVFHRDGKYQQTDGAREGDVGTYYFSGNRFCIIVPHRKMKRCRSVLIDRDRQTWLVDEGEESRPVRVIIGHY
jgi:hypothetical protein